MECHDLGDCRVCREEAAEVVFPDKNNGAFGQGTCRNGIGRPGEYPIFQIGNAVAPIYTEHSFPLISSFHRDDHASITDHMNADLRFVLPEYPG